MSKRDTWKLLYERFDPEKPAVDAHWWARRAYGPERVVRNALALPFGTPHILLLGTTGTGKSTELLRMASERADQELIVLLDLHQHFAGTVGDAQALTRVEAWEVVFLAGLAIARAVDEMIPYPDDLRHLLEDLGKAWERTAAKAGAPEAKFDVFSLVKSMAVTASRALPAIAPELSASPDFAVAASGGLQVIAAAAGAMRWALPVGRSNQRVFDQDLEPQKLLAAVNAIVGYVQSKARRVLLVIDGLDRIASYERASSLFIESSMIAGIDCPMIVVGPFALRSHPARAALRGFDKTAVLANEPVLDKHAPASYGPGIEFFCELYRKRTDDIGGAALLPKPLLERLAYYSGGRARDFVKLIRMLAEGGWMADADVADEALVDDVLNEARRLLEAGLDRGHLDVLEAVVRDADHVLPEDERARDLLSYGQLLPYPNESEWYYPHPLLTMHLVRTRPPSSSG